MNTQERRKRAKSSAAKTAQGRRPVRKTRTLKDSDVVYTPPKPFRRGRFILRLVTVAAVVLAMVFGMSIFFKVATVQVSGCGKYTAWEVAEASGIETGTNLMSVSRAQVSGNIISRLPYVDTVRVGINLPDTVNIEITELEVVYSIEDTAGNWWLMNDEGRIVDQTNSITAKSYTQVLGVKVEVPEVGQQAVAKEAEIPTVSVTEPAEGEATDDAAQLLVTTPSITVGPTNAERLRTALTILQQLSLSSLSDKVDSVNVTTLNAIELWYEERFQVNLGESGRLEYKISALEATIGKMKSYDSGHLDLSFTNWPDKVGYSPFT